MVRVGEIDVWAGRSSAGDAVGQRVTVRGQLKTMRQDERRCTLRGQQCRGVLQSHRGFSLVLRCLAWRGDVVFHPEVHVVWYVTQGNVVIVEQRLGDEHVGQLIRPGDRATGWGQCDLRWAKQRHLETLLAGEEKGVDTQDRRQEGHFLFDSFEDSEGMFPLNIH